jgi:hypothetical protein
MAYRDFTWAKVKKDFGLTTIENMPFLPNTPTIAPSSILQETLNRGIPWAIAVGNEKARSEAIINPILLEVKYLLKDSISLFSGEDFTVDVSLGLNGVCDFLISQSTEQLAVEAPAIVVVEAKKDDIKSGMGQCLAEMIAAQKFNQMSDRSIPIIYGCITTGTIWRFLKLEGTTVTVELSDYSLPPIDQVLGILVWMAQGIAPHEQ